VLTIYYLMRQRELPSINMDMMLSTGRAIQIMERVASLEEDSVDSEGLEGLEVQQEDKGSMHKVFLKSSWEAEEVEDTQHSLEKTYR
jgi:hypothetical protein